jgi:lysophospholipase L1-like esterase
MVDRPGMYTNDRRAGYRLSPHFSGRLVVGERVTVFSTNSLGLRDAELGRRSGVRVAAFGDSVTWGWSVAQGQEWIAEVRKRLEAEWGAGTVQTLNCGVPGYGTENELGLLEAIGGEIQPDVVLLGFFPNDFVDNIFGRNAYSVREGHLFDETTHAFLRESALARKSHLWRLLLRAKRQIATKEERLRETTRLQNAYFLAREVPLDQLHASVVKTAPLIQQMGETARRLGARFAVVWLPMDWQVTEPDADTSLDADLQRRVHAAGIPSLDLLPIFRAQPSPSALFFGHNDTHFTPEGHRVAGEAVAAWLLRSGLMRQAGPSVPVDPARPATTDPERLGPGRSLRGSGDVTPRSGAGASPAGRAPSRLGALVPNEPQTTRRGGRRG